MEESPRREGWLAERGEDLADALGVASVGTQRHVAVFGRQHQLLDGGHLRGRELTRVGARAGGAIVEGTGYGGVAPGMIASRLKVEDPQDEGEGEKGLRAFDGAEDVRLGRTVGSRREARLTPETRSKASRSRATAARTRARRSILAMESRRRSWS
jgi:hypothetical protein